MLLSAQNLQNITQIKLIRHAPRELDDDNLNYAFKHIRDTVADLIIPGLAPGRADGKLHFTYGQQRSKLYLVEIVLIEGTTKPEPVVL